MRIMRADDNRYRIGEVAKETGVSVEALRYYERLGLLPRPLRTARGARRYDAGAIPRVRFIKQAQALGLRLREILELVGGDPRRSGADCRNVHALLNRHIDEIDRRVRELRALRRALADYRLRCEDALAQESDPPCPTLEALTEGTEVTAAATAGSRRSTR